MRSWKRTHLLGFPVSVFKFFLLLLTQYGLSSGKKDATYTLRVMITLPTFWLCLAELSERATEIHPAIDVDLCPEGKYFSHQFCLECPPGH